MDIFKPNICNYRNKIFGIVKYSSMIGKDEYKKLSNEDRMDNLVISDIPKTTDDSSEIVVKEGRLALRHSSAAHVLTNDDLEDTDCRGSSGNSRGESV